MIFLLFRDEANDEAPSLFRSPRRTLAPSLMKRIVIAAPKPRGDAPPVIKATFPVSREREGVDGPWAGVVAGAVEGAREGPGAVMLLILDSGKVLVALVVQLLIVIVVTGCVLRNWVKMG